MKRYIFLALRGKGDCVILANALKNHDINHIECAVITFANNSEIFSSISSNLKIYKINNSNFISKYSGLISIFFIIIQYKNSINLSGDILQTSLMFFTGPCSAISPYWAVGHKFRRLIKPFPFKLPNSVSIHPDIKNLYSIHMLVLGAIFKNATSSVAQLPKSPLARNQIRIAIFVGAASLSRRWPTKYWIELFELILGRHLDFRIYLDPTSDFESDVAYKEYSSNIKKLAYQDLLDDLKSCHLGIALDSFSSHILQYAGIRSIIIYGSNSPVFFLPPLASAISQSGGCECHPCYNRPTCMSDDGRYICIRSIQPGAVIKKLDLLLDSIYKPC